MRSRITNPCCLLLALFTSQGLAQSDDPLPGSAERVEEAESVLPRVGGDESPIMPTESLKSRSVEPGLTEGYDWTKVLSETLSRRPSASTLAEGTFLLDRLGQLVVGPNNRLIFVPDHDQREAGEGPMLILPCSVQNQIAESWTGQQLLIRGEVFLYHGRNYLLPAWFSLVTEPTQAAAGAVDDTETEDSESPGSAQSTPAGDDEPASLEDDPQIRALLDELESEFADQPAPPSDVHRDLIPQTQPKALRSATTASGIREGTILLRRRGRLERQSDGSWSLMFDNDDATQLGAPSLTILPCRMLMEMENLSAKDGGDRELIVSGRVYASQGNGYLLPTLIQRVRRQGISPRQ